MPLRRIAAALAVLASLLIATHVDAQQFRGRRGSRIQISGWVGGLINKNSGFSSDSTDFIRFDRAPAVGGAVHVSIGGGLSLGIDGLYSKPGYTRLFRASTSSAETGDARMVATLLSARLQGTPGGFGIYFSGGAGFVWWDIPVLPDRIRDNALSAGVGVELPALPYLSIFGEYDQMWVYHAKVGDVVRNRVSRGILKAGVRLNLF